MNNVNLIGRLGKDPEQGNGGVVKFSIATNDGTKDKPKTNWHNIVSFGKTGEILHKHLKKGDQIGITGQLDYNEYEGKYYTSIIVRSFSFVGGGKSEQSEQQNTPPTTDDQDGLPF